ncbi:hypothetical protein ACLOJK_032454 [Asimina triloba]
MQSDRQTSTSGKLERKTIEKNRRILMKSLCSKLASLLPSYNPKVELSQQDQVCLATDYIKELKLRVEELMTKRELAKGTGVFEDTRTGENGKLPMVEVKDQGPTLEVVVIVGSDRRVKTCDIMSILVDEGIEVMNCSFSCIADTCIYSIYSKVITACGRKDGDDIKTPTS